MATKNEENWMMHYNELKEYVAVHHHFPDKHKSRVTWYPELGGIHLKEDQGWHSARGAKTTVRRIGGK